MSAGGVKLGNSSAAFGLAAAIVALFNTTLACTKDAYHPLNDLMNRIAGHNWTTQALADIILFIGLGLIFLTTRVAEKLNPHRLTTFVVASVSIASVGLFAWYAMY
jgi:uncharacterized membrane protein SirB2